MAERHRLFAESELDPGERRFVTVRRTEIAVFNIDGAYFALENDCPHQGGPVCKGNLRTAVGSTDEERFVLERGQPVLTCPWHGWSFEVITGNHPSGDYSLATYDVVSDDGELYLLFESDD